MKKDKLLRYSYISITYQVMMDDVRMDPFSSGLRYLASEDGDTLKEAISILHSKSLKTIKESNFSIITIQLVFIVYLERLAHLREKRQSSEDIHTKEYAKVWCERLKIPNKSTSFGASLIYLKNSINRVLTYHKR